MGVIDEVHGDLDADISLDEFRDAVEEKVEQMGGLADEETAAMLIAHELDESEVNGVADIEPGIEEVKFVAKVTSIGDVRTFERDGDDAEDGHVLNVDVADETGSIRISLWDEQAQAADEQLETGQVLRIKGRPTDGYSGTEVNVDQVEPDEDTEVDVQVQDSYSVSDLSLGLSDVNLQGKLLDTGTVRTFDRDDGSEGRVANLTVGDETGRIRITLWDERADAAEELDPDIAVEIVDGYVRERDGNLELHVGNRGAVEEIDADIEYVPESTSIADLEIGDTADIVGVIRSTDPKRTFDRDDGSEGQVKNVRVQDETGDIRVALWGEKADRELAPGDKAAFADVSIKDGWADDIEASAGWQSTISVLDSDSPTDAGSDDADETAQSETGLDAFGNGSDGSGGSGDSGGDDAERATDSGATTETMTTTTTADGEYVEFTGTVVQAGNPVVLDDGEETVSVETNADVHLGQEVTARGERRGGKIDAEDVF
ncbi:replication factor A [Haladaptatus sp. W1]|uniref:single-stranded DNA binding protein n=1 Tax=Haladaptatus sp. W1 TaxID=1897478 RepID=UPI0008496EF1|nr:single-stranded DNA binding protein [Haladaptatus sp. W1]ODR79581.1 replication factor A [Haladaptatus sp. W1]